MTVDSQYIWNLYAENTSQLSDPEEILSALKTIRGFSDEQAFFSPEYDTMFHNSSDIPDFDAVIDRLLRAAKQGEDVVIYGDYDADGITSSAILYETFLRVGGKARVVLPHRETDGYGLSPAVVSTFTPKPSLLIAIDNGTTAHEAVAEARKKGIDVVIIDHHAVQDTLPEDALVMNPMRKDSRYPFPTLCAAGLAFLVAREMCRRTSQEGQEKWMLDLAAVGTVADRVPLMDINRGIVHYGIKVLQVGRREGLTSLMDISGVSSIDTEALAFRVIPRLNAAGRLAHPDTAFKLLITPDKDEARMLARSLEELNRDRKKLSEEAKNEIDRIRTDRSDVDAYFFAGNWHIGIVGLLAGKVADETNRPVAIANISTDICVGSMRGNGVGNVVEILKGIQEHLISFGGHENAAGFSFKKSSLPVIQNYFNTLRIDDTSSPNLMIDCLLDPSLIHAEFVRQLRVLEPHGEKNERPMFLLQGLEVADCNRMGADGAHVRFSLKHPSVMNSLSGVSFRWGSRPLPTPGSRIDVACEIHLDRFRGREKVDMRIKDIRRAE